MKTDSSFVIRHSTINVAVTTSPLLCPQCGMPLTAESRLCSNCGVDVAVAALLLELTATESQAGKAAMAQEALVPRLGDFLIQRKIVTESQLGQALELHDQSIEDGNPQTLGQALVELGLITRPDLDRAILAQVVELQSALQVSNRQLEERVALRTTELESALKKVGEINLLKANFIANISHELRTPLAQIKGYAALLHESQLGKLNADQAVAVGSSVTAIEKLERLVEDLIRFASTTRGAVTIETNIFCLSEVAQSALQRAAAKAGRAKVQLQKGFPEQPIYAEGDAEKLAWVLFQLLDNAIKFTASTGSVTLTLKPERSIVVVGVRDTGIGISADWLTGLSQPFHQLDGTSTRRYGGTGLGLPLVRRILQAHSSEIEIDSAVGKGSTFSFSLRMSKPDAVAGTE